MLAKPLALSLSLSVVHFGGRDQLPTPNGTIRRHQLLSAAIHTMLDALGSPRHLVMPDKTLPKLSPAHTVLSKMQPSRVVLD